MKKLVIALTVAAVAVLVLVAAGVAYAQSNGPSDDNDFGFGMMGRRGHLFNQEKVGGDEVLHDEMVAAFAAKLGISATDLETRLANGETMAEIADSLGFSLEDFRAIMLETRNLAIDQALAAGELTEEQAEWMKERSSRMMGQGAGGRGRMGGRGSGDGQFERPGCPMNDDDDL
jgi:hypothetical protein